MTTDLAKYVATVEQVRSDAQALFAVLDEKEFNAPPPPGVNASPWSIGQQIAHLNRAGQVWLPELQTATANLREATPAGNASATAHYNVAERWYIGMMEPVSDGLHFPVPSVLIPPPGPLSFADTTAAFDRLQADLLQTIAQADGLDVWSVRLAPPALPLLRFSLGTWFAALATHERYHLGQATNIKNAPGK